MKKVFKVALVAICMTLVGNFAKAQSKIGYISQEDVILALPEYKTVQTQMAAYQKDWTTQLQTMNETANKSIKEYQDGEKTMSDAVKSAKVAEIQDMQRRYQEQQELANKQVGAKSEELMKPLFDKVKVAITAVAKEKGYSYVLNSSQTELLVAPDADNLLAPVKLELGIK